MTIPLTPFSNDTFCIVPRNDVLNDQLKDLSSQMKKPSIMEGIKKLGGVKYKLTISGKESEDPYILLDLLWSNTPLWSGSIKSVLNHKRFFSLLFTSHQQNLDMSTHH